MPFGASPWTDLGLAAEPLARFRPVVVRIDGAGELLVPLCTTGDGTAQIGCFGYGTVLTGSWTGERLPEFALLARELSRAVGSAGVRTLLPPAGAVPAVDALTADWPYRDGRPTFLLDVSKGPDAVWNSAEGRSRTAFRRAVKLGLTVRRGGVADAASVRGLYEETMARNGLDCPWSTEDFASMLGESANAVVTVIAEDGEGPRAATVFVASGDVGFHLVQATSQAGLRTNAGHLAFFSAVGMLTERGVRRLDLGAAADHGQERFKSGWGAGAALPRIVEWTGDQP